MRRYRLSGALCAVVLLSIPVVLRATSSAGRMAPPEDLTRFNDVAKRSREMRDRGNYLGAVRILKQEWKARWRRETPATGGLSRRFGLQILAENLQAVGAFREAQARLLERDPPAAEEAALPAADRQAIRRT